jgi:hypothetical protein
VTRTRIKGDAQGIMASIPRWGSRSSTVESIPLQIGGRRLGLWEGGTAAPGGGAPSRGLSGRKGKVNGPGGSSRKKVELAPNFKFFSELELLELDAFGTTR